MRAIAGLLAAAFTAALVLAPARAQTTQGPVKVGVLTDMSSLYADLSGQGSVEAARMAIEDFGGKLLGQPIQLVSADHQNKPDIGASIARKWYGDEGVDVILDVPTSSVALAVEGVSRNMKKLVLFTGAGSSDITGTSCSPYAAHWVYDTYALAHGTGSAIVKQGGKTWYFLTADYAFGHALERDTAAVVEAEGGKVLGQSLVPLNTSDFSNYLLAAQSSKAQVVGLANAGGDTTNSIKQAAEFGSDQSRPEAGGAAGVHHRCEFAWVADGARLAAHGWFLLGPDRCDPRVVEAVLQRDPPRADHEPGRGGERAEALFRRCAGGRQQRS